MKKCFAVFCVVFLLVLGGCSLFGDGLANTRWSDENGRIYYFNEDATLVSFEADDFPMYMWRNGRYWTVIISAEKGMQPEWPVVFEENEDGTLSVTYEDDPENVVIWTRVADESTD